MFVQGIYIVLKQLRSASQENSMNANGSIRSYKANTLQMQKQAFFDEFLPYLELFLDVAKNVCILIFLLSYKLFTPEATHLLLNKNKDRKLTL